MKKALLLGAALMFIASGASAQLIGLFTDVERTEWNATSSGGIVTVYVFALPTPAGMTCLELSTEASNDNFMAFATTWHADIVEPKLGNIPNENLVACWASCKDDWTMFCSAGLFMQSAEELIITVAPYKNPTQPFPKMLTCALPADELEAYAYSMVCINTAEPCPLETAVEESTWGAIKNLYE